MDATEKKWMRDHAENPPDEPDSSGQSLVILLCILTTGFNIAHDWSRWGWQTALANGLIIVLLFWQFGSLMARRLASPADDFLDLNATIHLMGSKILRATYILCLIGLTLVLVAQGLSGRFIEWLSPWALLLAAVVMTLILGSLDRLILMPRSIELSPAGVDSPDLFAGTIAWSEIKAVNLRRRLILDNDLLLELHEPRLVRNSWLARLPWRSISGATPALRVRVDAGRFCVDARRLRDAIQQRITTFGTF